MSVIDVCSDSIDIRRLLAHMRRPDRRRCPQSGYDGFRRPRVDGAAGLANAEKDCSAAAT